MEASAPATGSQSMPRDLVRLCRKCLLLISLGPSLLALAAPVHAAGNEETVAGNFLRFLLSGKMILSGEVIVGNLQGM